MVYLLMLLALIGLCFFPSRKLIATTGVLGVITTYKLWTFAEIDLDLKFYGSAQANKLPPFRFGKGVDLTAVILVLLCVMLAISFVSWNDTRS